MGRLSRRDAGVRRSRMVERDIEGRGIRDVRVLEAMRKVPRERFVSVDLEAVAYDDNPLPIGDGQTISQPYIVAAMTEAAEIGPEDRVLEVGTGSGYGAAVLSHLAAAVWTIERLPTLAERAAACLGEQGYDNVVVVIGDGTLGWPSAGPFDAIIVTAGGPSVPDALVAQLGEGGRLVIPVGPELRRQELVRIRRRGEAIEEENLGAVRFVPLIGEQGYDASPTRFPG